MTFFKGKNNQTNVFKIIDDNVKLQSENKQLIKDSTDAITINKQLMIEIGALKEVNNLLHKEKINLQNEINELKTVNQKITLENIKMMEEIELLKDELKKTNKKGKSLQPLVTNMQTMIDTLNENYSSLNENYSLLNESKKFLEENNKYLQDEITKLNVEKHQLLAELQVKYETLSNEHRKNIAKYKAENDIQQKTIEDLQTKYTDLNRKYLEVLEKLNELQIKFNLLNETYQNEVNTYKNDLIIAEDKNAHKRIAMENEILQNMLITIIEKNKLNIDGIRNNVDELKRSYADEIKTLRSFNEELKTKETNYIKSVNQYELKLREANTKLLNKK